MAVVIILIIAFWFLDLPLALQILMTIFGSLHCLCTIIKICANAYTKQHRPTRTGYSILDKFLER